TVTVAADGSYSYTPNPDFNGTDSFTVQVADGEGGFDTEVVNITIAPTGDDAVIGGVASDSITEDVDLSAGGTLTITDNDAGQAEFQPGTATGDHGDFAIAADGVWTYTATDSPAIQSLGANDTFVETFQVTSEDGTATETVTVTINGTNDAPEITGGTSGDGLEDGGAVTGTVTATDVDATDDQTFSLAEGEGVAMAANGTVTVAADGSYSYTPNPDFNGTDSFTVQVADGEGGFDTEVVNITIAPVNDDATITGNAADDVFEDGALSAGGTLTVSDVDAGENVFQAGTGSGAHGDFSIAADGVWTYSGTDDATIQALGANDSLVETFTVSSADGTATQTVTVTINGTNDAPEITGGLTGSGDEDGLAVTGTVTATDVDATDDQTFSLAEGEGVAMAANGSVTVAADGSYSYTPNPDFNGTDSFTVQVADGEGGFDTEVVNITIAPVNDDATITGSASDDVVEDGDLLAGGTLTATDADAGESGFVAAAATGAHGSFTIDADGNWNYALDNTSSDVQALSAGETVDEIFTVTTNGNETTNITVTITGSNDGPVVTGGASADTLETSVEVGGSVIIGSADLLTTDIDNTADELTYTLTSDSGHGDMFLDGVQLNVGDSFTQADIDNNLLSYTNDGTAEGGTGGSAEFEWAEGTPDWVPPSEQDDYTPSAINQDNLTSPADGTSVTVTFQGEGAGYHNAMGWYKIVDGQPTEPQIMWQDASQQGSGGSLVPGQDSVTLDGMAAGDEFGFFIVRDGASDVGNLGGGTLSFDANGNLVDSDGGSIDGSQLFHTVDNNLTDGSLNEDNVMHGTSGLQGDDLMIGFEDLWGGGDNDYNDLMVSVSYDVPAPSTDGSDSFAFTVTDGDGGFVGDTTFDITVTGVGPAANEAPTAIDIVGGAGEDSLELIVEDAIADGDLPEGAVLSVTTDSPIWSAKAGPNGSVIFTALAGAYVALEYDDVEVVSFNYTVTDDQGASVTKTAEITVSGSGENISMTGHHYHHGADISTDAGGDSVNLDSDFDDDVSVSTGAGDDLITLDGTFEDVTIAGGTGDDTITLDGVYDGGRRDDVEVDGGTGDDNITLSGTFKDDVDVTGGDGDDTIILDGTFKDDVNVQGGAGDDTITFSGSLGRDDEVEIDGGAGNDVITGGAEDETLIGGTGDDTLTGGAGDDDLWGGDGNDTFVFHEGDGSDTINDFGIGDTMVFEGTWFDEGTVTQDGDDAIVTFGTGDDEVKVTVKDSDARSLSVDANQDGGGGYSITQHQVDNTGGGDIQ
ncbi:MAG: tandem-95 repeat protein, partial [Rhodospirillales bacterium]|nr:tandem-95 repeat protein [Rhodospirillales bacterium]